MGVNSVSNTTSTAYTPTAAQTQAKTEQKSASTNVTEAATYEKNSSQTGSSRKTSGKPDMALVQKMKADAEARNSQLRSLVEKMMTKQGQTFNNSTDIFKLLREGKLKVDPETAAQAQKDISEDGYWGVEQTSDRLVSFAKALSGGDTSKADELISAMKKGFGEAKKTWGGNLPDISNRTIERTLEKMEKWKNGEEE